MLNSSLYVPDAAWRSGSATGDFVSGALKDLGPKKCTRYWASLVDISQAKGDRFPHGAGNYP